MFFCLLFICKNIIQAVFGILLHFNQPPYSVSHRWLLERRGQWVKMQWFLVAGTHTLRYDIKIPILPTTILSLTVLLNVLGWLLISLFVSAKPCPENVFCEVAAVCGVGDSDACPGETRLERSGGCSQRHPEQDRSGSHCHWAHDRSVSLVRLGLQFHCWVISNVA